jgi:hypothetical protein
MRAEEALRILGLPASATPAEIKAAYRRLVKLQHPDRHVNDPQGREAAAQKLTHVIEAYRCLRRPAAATAPADATDGSTFSIRRAPPQPSAPRRQSPRPRARRSRRRLLRKWWPAFAAAALVIWTLVSFAAAVAAVDIEARLRATDSLVERATCYSANRAEYEDCVRARSIARSTGRELKPPMLTPFRVSLCATLQDRFSGAKFWDCVKALSDPRQ